MKELEHDAWWNLLIQKTLRRGDVAWYDVYLDHVATHGFPK